MLVTFGFELSVLRIRTPHLHQIKSILLINMVVQGDDKCTG